MFVTDGNSTDAAGTQSAISEGKKLERKGHTPSSIFKEKGCFRGPDGHWRHEISDKNARMTGNLRNGRETTLDKAMDHQELFKVDPSMRKTKIQADRNMDTPGAYDPDHDRIFVKDPNNIAVALHEAQHAKQKRDGLPESSSGSSADNVAEYVRNDGEIEAFDVMHRHKNGTSDKPDLVRKAEGQDVRAKTHMAPAG